MKKFFFMIPMVAIMFAAASVVNAQDDYSKGEFFAGYQFSRIESTNIPAGFMVAGTGNFSKMLGVKGEYSYSSKDGAKSNTFMGGLQVKDNSSEGSQVRPFAHVLGGLVRYSADGFPSANGFGMTVGGGIDYKATEKVSIRLAQVDYRRGFGDVEGNTVRFGFGVVFH
jgi:opacity protein-like surface antigen